MALQSSGAISFANLASEFGGLTPHSFSEDYRDGGNVPSTVSRDADAASLTDSVSDGRGAPYTTFPVINSGEFSIDTLAGSTMVSLVRAMYLSQSTRRAPTAIRSATISS